MRHAVFDAARGDQAMRATGIATVALLVGCATGVAVREVVFPARAANAPVYDYKMVRVGDLIDAVKAQNPKFANADRQVAAEEGMRGFGRSGWRYAGCLKDSLFGWGSASCSVLIFEQTGAVGSSPPARLTPEEEPQAMPPPPMAH
jgi:hypothetical protein